MTSVELRGVLKTLEISSSQLADLLTVTTRAVDMWLSGEREVSGPAEAYINLLVSLPKALFAKELTRLKKEPEMLEGMYRLDFSGNAGFGIAALVLKNGSVFGSDVAGVQYDGSYEPTGIPGEVSMSLMLSVPPGVTLVQGVVSDHRGFTFKVGPQKINLLKSGEVTVATPVNGPKGVVRARITKLRNIPE